jgi:hypothetical protein
MAKTGRAKKSSNGKMTTATSSQAKADTESISGYFGKVFKEHPHLLNERSNEELLARWRRDHPGDQDMERIRQNLANIKSVLRKKKRDKRGRKAKAAGDQAVVAVAVTMAAHPSRARLEALEESIDECLTMAKNMDREGLDSIIKVLRRARNEVVWKLGQ